MVECKDTHRRTISANLLIAHKQMINKEVIFVFCKNSSGKVFGEVEITENKIIVQHYKKPLLIIDDVDIVSGIIHQELKYLLTLYDEYELCIGEIAALYNRSYHQINPMINNLNPKTSKSYGRRNSSYGQTFSDERIKHLSESHKGVTPVGYERTPEIRQKISQTLIKKYASGEIWNDPKKFSDAWARGCYKNVKMGRGIQGYMFSIKNQIDIYFRSLLELNYFILFEQNEAVEYYEVEPFQIKMSGDSHYTPDALINSKYLIEIKPSDHLRYTDSKRFEEEVLSAQQYCEKNELEYIILYDTDINFKTTRYKTFLRNNPDIIEQFNIRFNNGQDAIKADW